MSIESVRRFTDGEVNYLATLVDDRRLELIILPTEKCNFRCTYCYEDFVIGKMKRETIDALKKLIGRRMDELDEFYVSWFGGEPLLAKDVVLEISRFAEECSRLRPRKTYRGGMTTNAYLLDAATFSALAEAGVLDYQITLDGPREIHNRTRVKADGSGSFDEIWENLLAIRATDFPAKLRLRIHYDKDTAFQMAPLLEKVRSELLPDSRFLVHFHDIERLGSSNDAHIKVVTREEKRVALDFLNCELYGDDFTPSEPEPYVCYAARPTSLLIRADGRIGKCTVALNDERNVIGRLNPDGTLSLYKDRIAPWLRGLGTLDPDVLECPLAGLPTKQASPPVVQITR